MNDNIECVGNRYLVYTKDVLGTGSFSTVYKGRDKTNDLNIAVKKIDKYNPNMKKLKNIDEEIKILQIIKSHPHPNIVKCYDILETNDFFYIIMELCDCNLKSILTKPIKEKYAKFYYKQLLNGMNHLVLHNIVHRDLKPQNILLTDQNMCLKIADFGLSSRSTSKHITMQCGSPMYMAPEILNGSKYNNKIDIWSSGIILYEILFNINPFYGCKKSSDIIEKIHNIEIPPKSSYNISISNECFDILESLLEVNEHSRISWEKLIDHEWILKDENEDDKIIQVDDNKNEYDVAIFEMDI